MRFRRRVTVSRGTRRGLRGSARQVGGLSAATLWSQVILLIASIPLARLYSPEQMGAYASILGIITLAATVATFSLPVAIPVTPDKRQASDLFWISVASIAAVALLLAGAVLLARPRMPQSINSEGTFAVTVAVGTAVLALWGLFRAVATRALAFNRTALSTMTDSTAQAGAQLTIGLSSPGAIGLTSGYFFGKILSAALLLPTIRGNIGRYGTPFKALRTWWRYPVLATPTALLNQASITAIAPVIAGLYGASVAGQFSLSMRILAAPAALVGQAVSTVLFPSLARVNRAGANFGVHVVNAARSLTLVALPIFAAVALFGPELFSLLFGQEWRAAGQISAVLAPWLAVNLVSSPLAVVATIHHRQLMLLMLGVIEASSRFAALWIGARVGSELQGFILYSLVGFVISLFYIQWTLRLSSVSMRACFGPLSRLLSSLVLAIALLWIAKMLIGQWPYYALSTVFLIVTSYFCLRRLADIVLDGRREPDTSS